MPMREPGYLQIPFAAAGDRAAIPTTIQPGGQLSMQQGWTPDYQLELGVNPAAKAIDRQQTNQLMFILSALLQRWQTEAFPEWIDPANNGGTPYTYPLGALIRVPNGASWNLRLSTVANNTTDPTNVSAAWVDPMAALVNAVVTNNASMQTMAGALTVGAGSRVGGTRPPRDATDSRIPTLEWATDGKATIVSEDYSLQKFPYWMSTSGNLSFADFWGVCDLPRIGSSNTYQRVLRLTSGSSSLDNIKSAINVNARIGYTNVMISCYGRFYDTQQIEITAVVSDPMQFPTVLPVQWSMRGHLL